jgi:hypothetical protein
MTGRPARPIARRSRDSPTGEGNRGCPSRRRTSLASVKRAMTACSYRAGRGRSAGDPAGSARGLCCSRSSSRPGLAQVDLVRRRHVGPARHGHLGHRLRHRSLLDRGPGVRRAAAARARARRHRVARPVMPRPAMAAHARVGAARLGQGRRAAHRPRDRAPPTGRREAEGCGLSRGRHWPAPSRGRPPTACTWLPVSGVQGGESPRPLAARREGAGRAVCRPRLRGPPRTLVRDSPPASPLTEPACSEGWNRCQRSWEYPSCDRENSHPPRGG